MARCSRRTCAKRARSRQSRLGEGPWAGARAIGGVAPELEPEPELELESEPEPEQEQEPEQLCGAARSSHRSQRWAQLRRLGVVEGGHEPPEVAGHFGAEVPRNGW